jgi:DNA-binding HxlR family transcriptional regulator
MPQREGKTGNLQLRHFQSPICVLIATSWFCHDCMHFASGMREGVSVDKSGRSGCPINLTLETLGDRWSLIVIRDIMFGSRRHYRELLAKSEERIASNILADRLKRLVKAGLLSTDHDPTHKQKTIYSLAEPAIQLMPMLAIMGAWGVRHTPASRELSVRAKLLEDGGPSMWDIFMDELRHVHLGAGKPGRSIIQELATEYEAVMAR